MLGTASTTSSASAYGARRARRAARRRRRGRGSRSRYANAVPHAPAPTTTARILRPAPEVDDDRDALEPEPLAQLVLDPVAVVAGDQPLVVDGEAEARRPRRDLRAVEEVQPAPPLDGGWRASFSSAISLFRSAVEMRLGVAVVQLGDLVEQPRDAAAGHRGDGDEVGRWRSRRCSSGRTSSIVTSQMSHFARTISVAQCALRATSTAVMSPSTIPWLASIRTSATSARSAASSARSSE